MNRRHFLSLALALTGAGIITLTGCGGGGGGSTSLEGRRAIVQLPAGVALNLTDLMVEIGQGSASVDTSGVFIARVPVTDLPSMALVRDQAGRGVLMGFLPAEGNGLTTLSAAVALLYYALGGFMLPENARRSLVNLLESDAASIALAGVISRRMVANPYVLEADDAEINVAVKAAYDTLVGTSRAVRTQSFRSQVARTRAEPAAMLLVQPDGLQSNVEVTQGGGTTVDVTNHSRRFGRVYTYQTGTPDALPKAVLQGAPLSLPSTNALGIYSTINNLVSGQTAYVPKSVGPISLPLAPNSKKTFYEIIVVGASTNDLPRGFYSEGKYVDEQAKWVQDREDLSVHTWWENLILPTFFEALGIAGTAVATVAVEGSLSAIKALTDLPVKQLLLNAGKGEMLAAATNFWELIVESTSAGRNVRKAMLPLYEAAVGQLAAETAEARALLFAKMVVRAAITAVVLLGLGDMGAVIVDVGSAQPAERWNITVFQPDLILDPTEKTIGAGQRVTFLVKPPPGLNGTVSYAWSTAATFAVLSSSDGVVGKSITTSSTSVDLVTTPSDQGKITVTVTATLTAPNGTKSTIGTAQAVITISNQQVIGLNPGGGLKAADNGFGIRYYAYIIYTVPIPQGNWTLCQLSGYHVGSLSRADYDKGVPVADLSANTDFSSWVYYDNSGSACINLGSGSVGFIRDVTHGDPDAATAQGRLNTLLEVAQGYTTTATFS
ncbi:MAG: hypothetical protein QM758_04695 [Armatimonas sp.]